MEFLAIVLSGLLSLLSPANFVLDRLATSAIRHQLTSAEELQVRIDNTPSYRALSGRIDRVRIAGRGLVSRPGLRIATLDIETDPIAVVPASLQNQPQLEQPLQAALNLVLTPQDINSFLQSPTVAAQLRDLGVEVLGGTQAQRFNQYTVVNPHVVFLPNGRVQVQVILQEQESDRQLALALETELAIVRGRQLQLVEAIATVNGQRVPSQLTQSVFTGISRAFDLQRLQENGLTVRVLQLKIEPDTLAIAAFVRVEPTAFSEN